MLLSMTGFASASIPFSIPNGEPGTLYLLLKSINARYFEVSCKLPYQLQPLEIDCINLFREHLYRGKITFSIQTGTPTIFHGTISPSLALIHSYVNAAHRVQQETGVPGTVTISDLIAIPDLFSPGDYSIDEGLKITLLQTIKKLCHQLTQTRQEEGKALAADIQARCKIISQSIQVITTLFQQNFELRRQKTMAEIQLLEQAKDTETIRHQIHLDLMKTDINEELVRFHSHLETLKDTLANSDIEKGRRIDFVLQEMLREINTIASKSLDAPISSLVITIKVELDKIREQAQNVV